MPKNSGVGRALIKKQQKKHKSGPFEFVAETSKPIVSIIDQNDLDEYMTLAAMAHKNFDAEKRPEIISETRIVTPGDKVKAFKEAEGGANYVPLRLPRKPAWNLKMTAEQYHDLETQSYLQWRRELAATEESKINSSITPFEKSLDMWRQLWRVIERCDTLCQIVDSRNPLFFRSPDLEAYIKEVGSNKKFLIILNKSDLLTEEARQKWAEYYTQQGVDIIFFSAIQEQELLDKDQDRPNQFGEEFEKRNSSYVHSVRELLAKLTPEEGQIKVGFVGYPNVGKSSLINVLCGRKRVGVTSTPGKTKHLQTVPLNDKITLFDCPGLVFPSFVSSRAEMVTCGVLPIDNLTDFMSPIELLCTRVPSVVFEQTYGLKLGGRVPAQYLLSALATERGYYNGAGLPDQTKAARFILKDYVRGKLLYCHLPPGHETEPEPLADLNTLEEHQKLVDTGYFKPNESPRLNFDADGGVTLHANFKLTKQEKRELKFSYKRGEDINSKLQEIGQKKQGGAGFVIKSKKN